MGYTRYWTSKSVLDRKKFERFSFICQSIIDSFDIELDDVIITDNLIRFNGVGGDAHETFYFNTSEGFHFCKTQLKPYDDVVCACLEVAKMIFKNEIHISNDGDNNDKEVKIKLKSILRDKKINDILN